MKKTKRGRKAEKGLRKTLRAALAASVSGLLVQAVADLSAGHYVPAAVEGALLLVVMFLLSR